MPPTPTNRITLPKRKYSNPSTSAAGTLAGGMGMNAPQIGSASQMLNVPQLGGTQFKFNTNLPGLRPQTVLQPAVIPGTNPPPPNTVQQTSMYQQYVQNRYPLAAISNTQTPRPTNAFGNNSLGDNAKQEKLDLVASFQQIEGARPGALSLHSAMALFPGGNLNALKEHLSGMGYEYDGTQGQGGIFRYTGAEGSEPGAVGNSPGSGYTWSNGAWHAPAGEDPNSDKKSEYYSRSRGWVTPEVKMLLDRRKRRRARENDFKGQQKQNQNPQDKTVDMAGLVNFRAGFG